MTLLIVTPMHNEIDNVAGLVETLRAQRFQDFDWVVVDDGSTDGTAERLSEVDTDNIATILAKDNSGGLLTGSEFKAWRHGVVTALPKKPYTHVMKMDADVRLAPDYLERIVARAQGPIGIAGGIVVTKGMAEQKFHVQGSVKLYTIEAYRATESMPEEHGFDAVDEMAASLAGAADIRGHRCAFSLDPGCRRQRGRNQRPLPQWPDMPMDRLLVPLLRLALHPLYLSASLRRRLLRGGMGGVCQRGPRPLRA